MSRSHMSRVTTKHSKLVIPSGTPDWQVKFVEQFREAVERSKFWGHWELTGGDLRYNAGLHPSYDSSYGYMCPVTFLARYKTGYLFCPSDVVLAGQAMKMSEQRVVTVANASDNHRSHSKRLRRLLLEAVGLPTPPAG